MLYRAHTSWFHFYWLAYAYTGNFIYVLLTKIAVSFLTKIEGYNLQ